MRKSLLLLSALIGGIPMLAAFALAPALADESVTIGGSRAVLIKPSAPRGSVILLPGGDGAIRAGDNGDIQGLRGNQLVRRGMRMRRGVSRCLSPTQGLT